ncbi:Uncharacterised protein [Moraxella caviae]|uniref:Uncharacterized protein n=1 Tax=Moraxella caviae TaxID=34060 RepID=A0A378R881_9GAMM|nr:hypothetical protein [Moraxella caviae]STZ13608.1 Uncharacterised protein [Moraxella caviae]
MLTPDTFHQILQESEILSDLFFHQVLQESEIVLGWMGLGFQPGFENSQTFNHHWLLLIGYLYCIPINDKLQIKKKALTPSFHQPNNVCLAYTSIP